MRQDLDINPEAIRGVVREIMTARGVGDRVERVHRNRYASRGEEQVQPDRDDAGAGMSLLQLRCAR